VSHQIFSECGCKYRKLFHFLKQKIDYFLIFLNIVHPYSYLSNNQALSLKSIF
jgi:hypothetical protein